MTNKLMSSTKEKQSKFCRAMKSPPTELSHCLTILLMVFHLHQMEVFSRTLSVAVEPSNVSFYYYVDEDVAEGSFVADLSADFTRVYHVDEEERQQLMYLVFDRSTDAAVKLFDVDDRTGVLTTTLMPGRRLDREELCDRLLDECVLSFDVVVQPYFQLVKVKVEVVDINDNAPVIELVDGEIQLYESAELRTELYIGTARDLDSQRHGIDSCHLEDVQSGDNTTSFFSLIVRRRLDDARLVDLYLRLTSTLDRETDGDLLVSTYMSLSPHTDIC